MVMHARKQPRLNDGYAEGKDTHLHKDMQYDSALFTGDSDDDGPPGSRGSPRHQNKTPYIERNKEKRGSISLAEKKVRQYLATGSLGRPVDVDPTFSFKGESEQSTQGHRSSTTPHKERSSSQCERGAAQGNREQHNSYGGSKSQGASTHQHHHHSSTNEHQHQGNRTGSSQHREESRDGKGTTNNGKQSSTTGREHGKDKEQVQKSALRVCGDWSEHISSSGKRYYYNCRSEVSQWEKPKEWNSELCKTPKDNRPRASSQSSANKITAESRSSRHSSSDQQEHGRGRFNNSDSVESNRDSHPVSKDSTTSSSAGHAQPAMRDRRESRDSHHSIDNARDRDNGGTPYKSSAERHRSDSSNQQNSSSQHYSSSHLSGYHGSKSSSSHTGNNGPISDYSAPDHRKDAHFHQGDYKKSSSDPSKRRRTDSTSQRHYPESGPVDDMDISPSPSPSPTSSRPSSSAGTPQLPPSSTPLHSCTTGHSNHLVSVSAGGHHPPPLSSSPQGNPIPTVVNRQTVEGRDPRDPREGGGAYDKTIQTLQELHKALSMSIRAQQNTKPVASHPISTLRQTMSTQSMSMDPVPSSHVYHGSGNAMPIPTVGSIPAHQQFLNQINQSNIQSLPLGIGEENNVGRSSPVSQTSSRSSCGSPTPSDTSSQNAAIATQALTAAAMKREETAKLTASLSNYYNESLIGHVLGWHADHVEKQSMKLWEEANVNGSIQCSQISVQLKRARSQVRSAEIQSTVHEQRIMSSDQMRQEIENLKTPSSFLPS